MASEGPNNAATAVSDGTIGTVAWTNAGNVAADDGSTAATTLASSEATELILASDFGFSIPAGATIDGIEVVWQKSTNGSGTVEDNAVRIVKGGTIGTTDKSSLTWEGGLGVFRDDAYGGATDKWGETWTAEDINSSDFGAALSGVESTGLFGADPEVDVVTIEVFYTAGTPPASSSMRMPAGLISGRPTVVAY